MAVFPMDERHDRNLTKRITVKASRCEQKEETQRLLSGLYSLKSKDCAGRINRRRNQECETENLK
jgi:hypothetical protein